MERKTGLNWIIAGRRRGVKGRNNRIRSGEWEMKAGEEEGEGNVEWSGARRRGSNHKLGRKGRAARKNGENKRKCMWRKTGGGEIR